MKNLNEGERLSLKYIIILLLSLVMWFFLGGAASFLLSSLHFFSSVRVGSFILVFVPHIVMFLTLLLSSRIILKKSIFKLIDADGVSIKTFITISSITLIVLSLFSLINREAIVYNKSDTPGDKIVFLLLSLLLFLPQTAAEELVFRVIPEKIYSSTKEELNRIEKLSIALFSALFFTLPHLYNIEVSSSPDPILTLSVYFIWGFLSSSLALYFSSYTPFWAMHYANNLFSVVIISGTETTLSGAPFFYDTSNVTSSFLPLLIIVLFLIIFIFENLLRRKR